MKLSKWWWGFPQSHPAHPTPLPSPNCRKGVAKGHLYFCNVEHDSSHFTKSWIVFQHIFHENTDPECWLPRGFTSCGRTNNLSTTPCSHMVAQSLQELHNQLLDPITTPRSVLTLPNIFLAERPIPNSSTDSRLTSLFLLRCLFQHYLPENILYLADHSRVISPSIQ